MLKLTYGFLNNKDVGSAVLKIESCSRFLPTLAFRIGRMCRELNDNMKKAQEHFINMLKEYAMLDEKGVPLGLTTGQYQFESEEKREAFNKKFDELTKIEFFIHLIKLDPSELKDVGLTPKEMAAIEALVDFD